MPKIVNAYVPEPMYDSHRRIMVLPKGMTVQQEAAAILRLIRERR